MSGLLLGKGVIVLGIDEIGAGIAKRLAREGARIVLLDEQLERARVVAADIAADVCSLQVDYGSLDAVRSSVVEAAAQLEGVYGLINNVLPMPALAPLEQQTDAMFDDAFGRVQVAATAMQVAVSFMQQAGEGRIVNVGHRYGEGVNEGLAAYNAAAWSLVGITRTAAMEWGRYQIATNLLIPFAATPELEHARLHRRNIIELMLSQVPLRRAGDCTEDIGGAALFLVSDAANFINGEVMHADGGQHVAGAVLNPIKFV